MNLRVFKISGKAPNSILIIREVEFTGCFVKMEGSDTIEGYMEENGYTPYDPVRYIKGLHIEEQQRLAFTVMCNNMITLFYVFSNLKNQGFWAPYALSHGLGNNERRRVSIQLEEVLDEGEKNELVQKVATVKEKDSKIGSRSYQEFHECVKELPHLLEYYGSVPAIINSTPNVSQKERAFGEKSKPNKERKFAKNPKPKKKKS